MRKPARRPSRSLWIAPPDGRSASPNSPGCRARPRASAHGSDIRGDRNRTLLPPPLWGREGGRGALAQKCPIRRPPPKKGAPCPPHKGEGRRRGAASYVIAPPETGAPHEYCGKAG